MVGFELVHELLGQLSAHAFFLLELHLYLVLLRPAYICYHEIGGQRVKPSVHTLH